MVLMGLVMVMINQVMVMINQVMVMINQVMVMVMINQDHQLHHIFSPPELPMVGQQQSQGQLVSRGMGEGPGNDFISHLPLSLSLSIHSFQVFLMSP